MSIGRIVSRFKLAVDQVAMEFDTPEAMKKYLEEHPGADKTNHSVKKPKTEPEGKAPLHPDHSELKDKSSPYYINRDNKWLKDKGDPMHWDPDEMYQYKEKLKAPFKSKGMKADSPAEKARNEAIRQISNWMMLVHDKG